MKDKNGLSLKIGDTVHTDGGYDLIVSVDEQGNYYGKLICKKGHSCENIPYFLNEREITKTS